MLQFLVNGGESWSGNTFAFQSNSIFKILNICRWILIHFNVKYFRRKNSRGVKTGDCASHSIAPRRPIHVPGNYSFWGELYNEENANYILWVRFNQFYPLDFPKMSCPFKLSPETLTDNSVSRDTLIWKLSMSFTKYMRIFIIPITTVVFNIYSFS